MHSHGEGRRFEPCTAHHSLSTMAGRLSSGLSAIGACRHLPEAIGRDTPPPHSRV